MTLLKTLFASNKSQLKKLIEVIYSLKETLDHRFANKEVSSALTRTEFIELNVFSQSVIGTGLRKILFENAYGEVCTGVYRLAGGLTKDALNELTGVSLVA